MPVVRPSYVRPLDAFNVKKVYQLGSVFSTMRAANLMANDTPIGRLCARISIILGFQTIDLFANR